MLQKEIMQCAAIASSFYGICFENAYFFNCLSFFQKQQTALHLACMNYDPSEQERIDVIVTLIEANSDYEQLDMVIVLNTIEHLWAL